MMRIELTKEVYIDITDGVLTSEGLKTKYNDPEDELYNAAIDGLESLVLAQVMAGVIIDEAYIEALKTSIDAISQNF